MCYSTMIEADLKNLEMRFGAKVDWPSIEDAFEQRRLYKPARIPAALDTYIIQNAKNTRQKRLARAALLYYETELKKLRAKKQKFENDCLEFEKKIKNGSKAKNLASQLEKRRQSVANLARQISHYDEIANLGAPRVFPNFYAPAIVLEKAQRKIKFMRYQILSPSGKELPVFKYNLFNARRDRLKDSKVWRTLFGKTHAVYPFFRFYESVENAKGESESIYFEADPDDLMWSAALFAEAKTPAGILRSQAAITDEPPPEVAATGHDRCPIYLEESLLDQWLSPEKIDPAELFNLLDQKTQIEFSHFLAA